MALPASAPAARRRPVRTVDAPRPAPTRLSVVPRRRPAVGWFVVLGGLVFALLLGVTVFQTRLAQNQLELDRVERAVDAERERFDELRLQRAELRSPAYLAAAAASIGMIPGSDTAFVAVGPGVVEAILVSTGGADPSVGISADDPFSAYGEVKALVSSSP